MKKLGRPRNSSAACAVSSIPSKARPAAHHAGHCVLCRPVDAITVRRIPNPSPKPPMNQTASRTTICTGRAAGIRGRSQSSNPIAICFFSFRDIARFQLGANLLEQSQPSFRLSRLRKCEAGMRTVCGSDILQHRGKLAASPHQSSASARSNLPIREDNPAIRRPRFRVLVHRHSEICPPHSRATSHHTAIDIAVLSLNPDRNTTR